MDEQGQLIVTSIQMETGCQKPLREDPERFLRPRFILLAFYGRFLAADRAELLNREVSSMALRDHDRLKNDLESACQGFGAAIDRGSMGDIVARVQELVVRYYDDVRLQAERSFTLAQGSAIGGGVIFFLAFVYGVAVDFKRPDTYTMFVPSALGVISGAIIQVYAGVPYFLYKRVAEQFSAFHICLERTHRYIVAYQIARETKENKDDTLHDLVCIMANAPMIPFAAAGIDATEIQTKAEPGKIARKSA
jgi:hypothetical protein